LGQQRIKEKGREKLVSKGRTIVFRPGRGGEEQKIRYRKRDARAPEKDDMGSQEKKNAKCRREGWKQLYLGGVHGGAYQRGFNGEERVARRNVLF